ncbi:MAG TPA: hypothetical protein VN520_21225 [Streptomyces sp.]|uniref:hypothetical protein n=1 Tax=Streptomyces sp. TaxID=1931 RepID=UPI002CE0A931|nr:hypothetical protein [Streptomyces sp.]HWU08871.1 hypothetical protein [Streptomyces sp.]
MTPTPVLLSAAHAAAYAGVRPATLRVWRHRYGLTRWGTVEGNLYDLEQLATVLARRAGDVDPGGPAPEVPTDRGQDPISEPQ